MQPTNKNRRRLDAVAIWHRKHGNPNRLTLRGTLITEPVAPADGRQLESALNDNYSGTTRSGCTTAG
jgi:hypothetical protein